MTTVAEAIKETAETFRHRIKNEFVFNYIFVWLAWNHKPILVMIFFKGDNLKQQALKQFEAMTWCESSGLPLLIAMAVVLMHPWVNWFVARYKNELVVPKLVEQREKSRQKQFFAEIKTNKLKNEAEGFKKAYIEVMADKQSLAVDKKRFFISACYISERIKELMVDLEKSVDYSANFMEDSTFEASVLLEQMKKIIRELKGDIYREIEILIDSLEIDGYSDNTKQEMINMLKEGKKIKHPIKTSF